MGVGLRISTSAEEILPLDLPTPLAGEERDSGETTMGGGVSDLDRKHLDIS
jgi:hypothetical protein